MRERIFLETNCDEIFLENYVIGYKQKGESIIVVLRTIEKILFSVVIDCYKDDKNITVEILKKLEIKNIDILCLTHPHDDHCIDMDTLLNNYCDKNSVVLLPNIDTSVISKLSKNSKEVYCILDSINRNNKKSNGELCYANFFNQIKQLELNVGNSKIDFRIQCFAPISKMIANTKNNNSLKEKINNFSIGLAITIQDRTFLYCGDIQNNTIKWLKDKIEFPNIQFLKIPHHGSIGSDEMLSMLKNKDDNIVCVATNYKDGNVNLPDDVMISSYSKLTNDLWLFNSDDSYYGVVKVTYKYRIKNYSFSFNVSNFGIANCQK